MGDGHGHLQEFLDHLGKRPHRSNREAEQFVFGKRLNHPAGKAAMALPMIQQRLGAEYGFG